MIDLIAHNTFGFHCLVSNFFSVKSTDELIKCLAVAEKAQFPVMILGGGSNVVLPKTLKAMVIGICNKGIEVLESNANQVVVSVAAGESWTYLVEWTLKNAMAGLENLSLIPGTVGAAPIQNIGAYGVEFKDLCQSIEVWDRHKQELVTLKQSECEFGYRHSLFKRMPNRYVILKVILCLPQNTPCHLSYEELKQLQKQSVVTPQMVSDLVVHLRNKKLPDPKLLGNAGSFFKNPVISQTNWTSLLSQYPTMVGYQQPNATVKVAAGWMIDHLGWRGKSVGKVAVHENQALVLVNRGEGSQDELWKLVAKIHDSVLESFNIELEIEPIKIDEASLMQNESFIK